MVVIARVLLYQDIIVRAAVRPHVVGGGGPCGYEGISTTTRAGIIIAFLDLIVLDCIQAQHAVAEQSQTHYQALHVFAHTEGVVLNVVLPDFSVFRLSFTESAHLLHNS